MVFVSSPTASVSTAGSWCLSRGAAMAAALPTLSLRHIFGLKGDVRSNIHYYDEVHVLYPAGQNIVVYNTETRSQFKIQSVGDSYVNFF